MRIPLVVFPLSLLLLLVGCAADTDPSSGAPGDENIESDEAALAAMKYYDCRGSFSDDVLARVEVGLSSTRIALTDLSKDAVPPDMGRLDRSYAPTPSYAGAIR